LFKEIENTRRVFFSGVEYIVEAAVIIRIDFSAYCLTNEGPGDGVMVATKMGLWVPTGTIVGAETPA
jgi:hypothetical protein